MIVTAGLAEVVADAIAMGLGGFLAAHRAEHYAAEEPREHHEFDFLREREIDEVEQIFREYDLQGEALKSVVGAVASNRQRWGDFMMHFELGLERPDPKRAPSALPRLEACMRCPSPEFSCSPQVCRMRLEK